MKGNERKQLVTMMNNKRGRHIERKIKIDRYERDEMNRPNSMLPVSVIPALSCAHSLSLCSLACVSLSKSVCVFMPPDFLLRNLRNIFTFTSSLRYPQPPPSKHLCLSLLFSLLIIPVISLSFDLYIFLC